MHSGQCQSYPAGCQPVRNQYSRVRCGESGFLHPILVFSIISDRERFLIGWEAGFMLGDEGAGFLILEDPVSAEALGVFG